MGYYRAAVISFDSVLEKYYDTPYSDDALYWKGESYRRMGEWDQAEEAFDALMSKYPQSPLVLKAKLKLDSIKGSRNKQKANLQELNP